MISGIVGLKFFFYKFFGLVRDQRTYADGVWQGLSEKQHVKKYGALVSSCGVALIVILINKLSSLGKINFRKNYV